MKQKHPLAEVFGFKIDSFTANADKFRNNKLCPYNNSSEKCTKDKKDNPLGVCSIYSVKPTVVCPVRFRENWIICKDAASFFFDRGALWTPLKEIKLPEKNGESAGKLDIVLISHDEFGKIKDFGAIEVQAVYVSGNIRRPFEKYMTDPKKNYLMDWTTEAGYPKPDYLSSSRKRLAPQLLYKGQILKAWNKKQAIVVDSSFFESLPQLPRCRVTEADLCWLIYELVDSSKFDRLKLVLDNKVFTGFDPTMETLGSPEIGELSDFVEDLEKKLSVVLNDLHIRYNVRSMSEFFELQERQKPNPDLSL